MDKFSFEVCRKDKVLFHCECESCVPSKDVQKSMISAGYDIFVNGEKRKGVWNP